MPQGAKQGCWLCFAVNHLCLPYSLSVAELCSFQVFWPGFLVRWARSYSQQWIKWWFNSSAWVKWEGQLQACSQVFWNRFSGQERPGATLSSGWDYELVSLPGQSPGHLQAWQGSLFVVLTQSDPLFPSALALWWHRLCDYQLSLPFCAQAFLSYVVSRLSGQGVLGAAFSSGLGYDSAPLPG